MAFKQRLVEVFEQNKSLVIISGVLVLIFLIARNFLHAQNDPREPPIIEHPIPFIGHVIGMIRHGASYFDIINKSHNHPIYTLPTLTGRTYIITSPYYASLIQRSSKATSFYSAILEVTRRICAFDKTTMDIIWHNVNGEDGAFGVMPETHDMVNNVLGPGPNLNGITKIQLEILTKTLGKLKPREGEVDLMDWLREQFTLANARAFYGPENPFDVHPELIKEFWAFEQGLMGLLANVVPSITARKAYLARKRVLAGLVEWVKKERYKKASNLIQKRIAIYLKHGITMEMAGHGELIMMFAILGNAIPTAFWMLANIYARPELLKEVREEVEKAVIVDGKVGEVEIRSIHIDTLKTVAPVLVSSFRETLRMVANLTSVRWILEDTIIGDKYVLKKDSITQVASGVIHMDEETWGLDAKSFNPRRFITTATEEKSAATAPLPKNVPSAAFRAFGGGSVICPGRHFALSEIVGFAALVVMSFDFEKSSGGPIDLPKRNNEVIPLAVMKPKDECNVVIKRRPGLEKVKWELEL